MQGTGYCSLGSSRPLLRLGPLSLRKCFGCRPIAYVRTFDDLGDATRDCRNQKMHLVLLLT